MCLSIVGRPEDRSTTTGKKQLAEDAIRWTSERVLAYQRACPAVTQSGVLAYFIEMWRRVVLTSGSASGCVVASVAIDTVADDAAPLEVARATFRSWVARLAEQFEATGVPTYRAAPIALATVAGREGALILCRAERGSGPLDAVAEEPRRLLPAETTDAGRQSPCLPPSVSGRSGARGMPHAFQR